MPEDCRRADRTVSFMMKTTNLTNVRSALLGGRFGGGLGTGTRAFAPNLHIEERR